MPHRLVRQVDPIVRHGLQELQAGATAEHTLREVAIMSALVGAGASPAEAMRYVERREEALVGPEPPGVEARERAFHGPAPGAWSTIPAPAMMRWAPPVGAVPTSLPTPWTGAVPGAGGWSPAGWGIRPSIWGGQGAMPWAPVGAPTATSMDPWTRC